MKITQLARGFAAKLHAGADMFIAAEEADAGMVPMSEAFKHRGAGLHIPKIE